ncbi:hypothetical protein ACFL6Y_00335 [Elusimicrobiota bacterium]
MKQKMNNKTKQIRAYFKPINLVLIAFLFMPVTLILAVHQVQAGGPAMDGASVQDFIDAEKTFDGPAQNNTNTLPVSAQTDSSNEPDPGNDKKEEDKKPSVPPSIITSPKKDTSAAKKPPKPKGIGGAITKMQESKWFPIAQSVIAGAMIGAMVGGLLFLVGIAVPPLGIAAGLGLGAMATTMVTTAAVGAIALPALGFFNLLVGA